MQHFTNVQDVDDPLGLLHDAKACQAAPNAFSHIGKDKTLGMIFFNSSLRTRMSTEKAAINLGMSVISLNATEGWNMEFEDGVVMNGDKAEHIREGVAVMSQYCDILGVRSFPTLIDRDKDYSDAVITKFKEISHVPVVSLEGATVHPLQSLTDWLTIEQFKTKPRPKVVLSWAPHPRALPQAVPNSFAEWMRITDYDFVITHPEGYELSTQFTEGVKIEYDQNEAFKNADFIYTKNWSSYAEYGKILTLDSAWAITKEKMARTDNGKFMHCLPVRRNQIVMDDVIDSPNSIVIQQARNRTFAAMAVLKNLLGK
ncbi:MAG: acetylornithine carbamoyltransferase [Saprospiraceae bacterium]|nr:acetylornithine carbamoyltransferase [Saprospiraceae bacterium]